MSDTSITIDLHNRQQAYAVIKEQLYPFLGHWLNAIGGAVYWRRLQSKQQSTAGCFLLRHGTSCSNACS